MNHKYALPHRVGLEAISTLVYRPESFLDLIPERSLREDLANRRPATKGGSRSQSERDWAFARRALARGDSPALVVAAIAQYRRFDKHNPQYYAELTVRKAVESLAVHDTNEIGSELIR